MNKKNFLNLVLLDGLYEIKNHICNQRYFEAGFGLGSLINEVGHQTDEYEQEDEEEDVDEEENSEENYYLKYLEQKEMRELLEKQIEEFSKNKKELEKTNATIESTRKSIFDLQDLLMRLLKFKKIHTSEIDNVLNILRNTGVEDCDIKVLCHLDEAKNTRK